ncbi:hypothetical protein LJB42_000491 [Komagataella kurtzmanii]|nr:hypothetical protein LJB42_000491 [Komagataella kurtzmanii]
MKLTITLAHNDQILDIDVSNEMLLSDLKVLLELETSVPKNDQQLFYNNNLLTGDDSPLEDLGLKDNELIILSKVEAQSDSNSHLNSVREQLIQNPLYQASLPPSLRDKLHDPQGFKEEVEKLIQLGQFGQYGPSRTSVQQELDRLQRDPDNPQNQKRIMELINEQAIEENMNTAFEISPESFVSVNMLYINVEINGVHCKAFVDSGAQTTIMSPKLAEKCNLANLIDKRFRGVAQGVGSSEIIGRIHSAPIKIEDIIVPCSFTVLDTKVDLLFGLDMLRRHQCVIDLKNNCLQIADRKTEFLGEADIPKEFFNQPMEAPSTAPVPKPVQPPQQLGQRPAGSPPSTIQRPAVQPPPVDIPPEKIQQLINLGFGEEESKEALIRSRGNVEVAAALLFN